MKRTHYNNDVREEQLGQRVILNGWVNRRRDHGGVIFVDLRDRTGLVQVAMSPERGDEAHKRANTLRNEYVIQVEGVVARRPKETENPNLDTGMIEVNVDSLTILAEAETPPFLLDDEVGENARLTHRFIDLRRPEMQRNLILRHRITQAIRRLLDDEGFLEIETPMLTRSTPEGARDYLVPSRVHPNQFYALPQSPQLFKQMLMVSGFDRYYQVARCFRDEDLRADRQPEFTQIDMEMSFVEPDDVMGVVERMMTRVVKEALGKEIKTPIPVMTYADAMDRYGRDAPDLRFDLPLTDLTEVMKNTKFKVFNQAANRNGPGREQGLVKALRVPGGASLTRKLIDGYTDYVGIYGAKGLAWIKVNGPWQEDQWQGPIVKFFSDEEKAAMESRTGAEAGDIIFFGADAGGVVNESLGRLREKIGKDTGLVNPEELAFTWVTEFPLLEWDGEARRHTAVHHPFTAPHPDDMDLLNSDPGAARAQAYDLVLNGSEIGGGSIRINDQQLQKRMFDLLDISLEEAGQKFGFLLKAFSYGAPPHGGVAMGLDRVVALMAGAESIRDVIAFPKTQKATCALTQAPASVDPAQLRELYLRSTYKPPKEAEE